jgi:hypothetical protein
MNDGIRIENFDICAVLDGGRMLAVRMTVGDSRYIVSVFPIEECLCITATLWDMEQLPMMDAIRMLRSMPCMFLEDVVLALDGDFYQVTITEMTDDGEFKATVTVFLPDDRAAAVPIELHEALSLSMNRGIPVHVEEQALDRFERYLMELPRWYDVKVPATRNVLHATHPERLSVLPELELKFLLERFNEQEDYESAALLHKALRIREESGR